MNNFFGSKEENINLLDGLKSMPVQTAKNLSEKQSQPIDIIEHYLEKKVKSGKLSSFVHNDGIRYYIKDKYIPAVKIYEIFDNMKEYTYIFNKEGSNNKLLQKQQFYSLAYELELLSKKHKYSFKFGSNFISVMVLSDYQKSKTRYSNVIYCDFNFQDEIVYIYVLDNGLDNNFRSIVDIIYQKFPWEK